MNRQFFIYYRIDKPDIDLGMRCAKQLMTQLQQQGLGNGQLFHREEVDKPYFTLMEVIHPAPAHTSNIAEFSKKLDQLAAQCFAHMSNKPSRHLEVFNEVIE